MTEEVLDKPKSAKVEMTVFLDGEGFAEPKAIKVTNGAAAQDLLRTVARILEIPDEELVLFTEDDDEPLALKSPVRDDLVYHVNRAREVEVKVFYQDRHETKTFRPAARIQKVLDWAVGKHGFKIDPAIAPEMELALHGSTTALPRGAHIGRYVTHPHHKVKLDLIRGVVPNGTPDASV